MQWSKPRLTGVFSTNFPNSWPQPWKQDGKVFIDHQRAQEHLEGFRFTQRGGTHGTAEGSHGGQGPRGSSREAFPRLAISLAAWQEPDQTRGQECASCSPRNGRNAASLSSSGRGHKLLLWALFPAARHLHTCQGKPPRCLYSFTQDVHAQRQL